MSKTERNKMFRINNDRKHPRGSGTQGSSHSSTARRADHSGTRRHLIEQSIKRESR